MVMSVERIVCYFGLTSIYAFSGYRFIRTKDAFNRQYHDEAIKLGNDFTSRLNNPRLKFISTPNDKILFLFGVENKPSFLSNDNLDLIQGLIENFTPNYFIYEKDLK